MAKWTVQDYLDYWNRGTDESKNWFDNTTTPDAGGGYEHYGDGGYLDSFLNAAISNIGGSIADTGTFLKANFGVGDSLTSLGNTLSKGRGPDREWSLTDAYDNPGSFLSDPSGLAYSLGNAAGGAATFGAELAASTAVSGGVGGAAKLAKTGFGLLKGAETIAKAARTVGGLSRLAESTSTLGKAMEVGSKAAGIGIRGAETIASHTPSFRAISNMAVPTLLDSASEAGNTYSRAIEMGYTPDEALNSANTDFIDNLPLNAVQNVAAGSVLKGLVRTPVRAFGSASEKEGTGLLASLAKGDGRVAGAADKLQSLVGDAADAIDSHYLTRAMAHGLPDTIANAYTSGLQNDLQEYALGADSVHYNPLDMSDESRNQMFQAAVGMAPTVLSSGIGHRRPHGEEAESIENNKEVPSPIEDAVHAQNTEDPVTDAGINDDGQEVTGTQFDAYATNQTPGAEIQDETVPTSNLPGTQQNGDMRANRAENNGVTDNTYTMPNTQAGVIDEIGSRVENPSALDEWERATYGKDNPQYNTNQALANMIRESNVLGYDPLQGDTPMTSKQRDDLARAIAESENIPGINTVEAAKPIADILYQRDRDNALRSTAKGLLDRKQELGLPVTEQEKTNASSYSPDRNVLKKQSLEVQSKEQEIKDKVAADKELKAKNTETAKQLIASDLEKNGVDSPFYTEKGGKVSKRARQKLTALGLDVDENNGKNSLRAAINKGSKDAKAANLKAKEQHLSEAIPAHIDKNGEKSPYYTPTGKIEDLPQATQDSLKKDFDGKIPTSVRKAIREASKSYNEKVSAGSAEAGETVKTDDVKALKEDVEKAQELNKAGAKIDIESLKKQNANNRKQILDKQERKVKENTLLDKIQKDFDENGTDSKFYTNNGDAWAKDDLSDEEVKKMDSELQEARKNKRAKSLAIRLSKQAVKDKESKRIEELPSLISKDLAEKGKDSGWYSSTGKVKDAKNKDLAKNANTGHVPQEVTKAIREESKKVDEKEKSKAEPAVAEGNEEKKSTQAETSVETKKEKEESNPSPETASETPVNKEITSTKEADTPSKETIKDEGQQAEQQPKESKPHQRTEAQKEADAEYHRNRRQNENEAAVKKLTKSSDSSNSTKILNALRGKTDDEKAKILKGYAHTITKALQGKLKSFNKSAQIIQFLLHKDDFRNKFCNAVSTLLNQNNNLPEAKQVKVKIIFKWIRENRKGKFDLSKGERFPSDKACKELVDKGVFTNEEIEKAREIYNTKNTVKSIATKKSANYGGVAVDVGDVKANTKENSLEGFTIQVPLKNGKVEWKEDGETLRKDASDVDVFDAEYIVKQYGFTNLKPKKKEPPKIDPTDDGKYLVIGGVYKNITSDDLDINNLPKHYPQELKDAIKKLHDENPDIWKNIKKQASLTTASDLPKRGIAKIVSEVRKAFNGSSISYKDGRITVSLPNKHSIIVDIKNQIVLTDAELDAAKKAHDIKGGEGVTVEGYAETNGKDAYIALARGSRDGVGFHEAYHVAEENYLTDSEKRAISKRFPNVEDRADAYANWVLNRQAKTPFKRIFQKINDFAHKVVAALTGVENTYNAFRKIESGEVFHREPGNAKEAKRFYSARVKNIKERVEKALDIKTQEDSLAEAARRSGQVGIIERLLKDPYHTIKEHFGKEGMKLYWMADHARRRTEKLLEGYGDRFWDVYYNNLSEKDRNRVINLTLKVNEIGRDPMQLVALENGLFAALRHDAYYEHFTDLTRAATVVENLKKSGKYKMVKVVTDRANPNSSTGLSVIAVPKGSAIFKSAASAKKFIEANKESAFNDLINKVEGTNLSQEETRPVRESFEKYRTLMNDVLAGDVDDGKRAGVNYAYPNPKMGYFPHEHLPHVVFVRDVDGTNKKVNSFHTVSEAEHYVKELKKKGQDAYTMEINPIYLHTIQQKLGANDRLSEDQIAKIREITGADDNGSAISHNDRLKKELSSMFKGRDSVPVEDILKAVSNLQKRASKKTTNDIVNRHRKLVAADIKTSGIYKLLQRQKMKKAMTQAELNNLLDSANAHKLNNPHFMKQTDKTGYSLNVLDSVYRRLVASANFRGNARFYAEATAWYADKFHKDFNDMATTNAEKFWQDYIRTQVRPNSLSALDKAVDEALESILNKPILKATIGKFLRKKYGNHVYTGMISDALGVQSILKLGMFNPSSALVQTSQLIFVNAKLGGNPIFGMSKYLRTGCMQGFRSKNDEKWKKLYDYIGIGGGDHPTIEKEMLGRPSNLIHKKLVKGKSIKDLADMSMVFFNLGEVDTRKATAVAGYLKAKDDFKGLSANEKNELLKSAIDDWQAEKDRAKQHKYSFNEPKPTMESVREKYMMDYARDLVVETNFDYSKVNTPLLLQKLGLTGKLVMQFKKYGVFTANFLAGNTKEENIRFLVPLFIITGAMGMPFVDLVDDASDKVTGHSPKQALMKEMYSWAGDSSARRALVNVSLYGAPSLASINISTRMGLSDFVGLDAGPTISTINNILEGQGVIKSLAPRAGSLDAIISGKYRNSKGDDVLELSPYDRMLKILGFKPIRETNASEMNHILRNYESMLNAEKKKAKKEYVEDPSEDNYEALRIYGLSDKEIAGLTESEKETNLQKAIKTVPKKDNSPEAQDLRKMAVAASAMSK